MSKRKLSGQKTMLTQWLQNKTHSERTEGKNNIIYLIKLMSNG